MANDIRIDLTDPALSEALADCDPGETHTITMDITITEKATELVGTVNPESVEKYSDEEVEVEEEVAPVAPTDTPAAVQAVV
jgi:hypothetical protein